jgi:hypothetical protein
MKLTVLSGNMGRALMQSALRMVLVRMVIMVFPFC